MFYTKMSGKENANDSGNYQEDVSSGSEDYRASPGSPTSDFKHKQNVEQFVKTVLGWEATFQELVIDRTPKIYMRELRKFIDEMCCATLAQKIDEKQEEIGLHQLLSESSKSEEERKFVFSMSTVLERHLDTVENGLAEINRIATAMH